MSLVNKLFGKKEESKKAPAKKPERKKAAEIAAPKREEALVKTAVGKVAPAGRQEEGAKAKAESKLLVPHVTEKASLAGSLGRYIFRVSASANKIDVAREISKVYKVKAVSVNLINVPGKERRVGRTVGFRSGYKKAVVKLAKGQTIEIK